jgi:hypothetical protein
VTGLVDLGALLDAPPSPAKLNDPIPARDAQIYLLALHLLFFRLRGEDVLEAIDLAGKIVDGGIEQPATVATKRRSP